MSVIVSTTTDSGKDICQFCRGRKCNGECAIGPVLSHAGLDGMTDKDVAAYIAVRVPKRRK